MVSAHAQNLFEERRTGLQSPLCRLNVLKLIIVPHQIKQKLFKASFEQSTRNVFQGLWAFGRCARGRAGVMSLFQQQCQNSCQVSKCFVLCLQKHVHLHFYKGLCLHKTCCLVCQTNMKHTFSGPPKAMAVNQLDRRNTECSYVLCLAGLFPFTCMVGKTSEFCISFTNSRFGWIQGHVLRALLLTDHKPRLLLCCSKASTRWMWIHPSSCSHSAVYSDD